MRRIKRQQKQKRREFIQAWRKQQPSNLPIKRLLDDFQGNISSSTQALVRLTLRSAAMVSAADYAATELNNQLNVTDITFDTDEIIRFSRKLMRMAILRRMLKIFHVPRDLAKQIVNLQIGADFGQTRSIMPVTGNHAQLPLPASRGKNVTSPRESVFTRPRPKEYGDKFKSKNK
jgi:hypothetical protein